MAPPDSSDEKNGVAESLAQASRVSGDHLEIQMLYGEVAPISLGQDPDLVRLQAQQCIKR